ncbi:MAG: hypothetical protein RLZZ262_758, partial [Bacteroidota bacterium]
LISVIIFRFSDELRKIPLYDRDDEVFTGRKAWPRRFSAMGNHPGQAIRMTCRLSSRSEVQPR